MPGAIGGNIRGSDESSVLHRIQPGGNHEYSGKQLAERQDFLGWNPFVCDYADEGRHEDGHEALGCEEEPDFRAEAGIREETAH